jgi:histidine ammonia-lyase
MGATSALKLRKVAENLETIIALEAFCAAQGVDFRKKAIGAEKRLGEGTQKLYDTLRETIPFIRSDEYMKVHIDSAILAIQRFNRP